jgi:hypothetical protein
MPRKRRYNTVTTDKFEVDIAWYDATRNYEAAAALCRLARDVGAPVDEDLISQRAAQNRESLNGLGDRQADNDR